MSVRLEACTPDPEALILRIARVSSDQSNTDAGLIGYLIRNNHWSPFEHAHMTLEIDTTRAIAAQILRHRSFTFQEFSQRYAQPEGYEPVRARRQAVKNRQSSVDDLDAETIEWFDELHCDVAEHAMDAYDRAISRGVAREVARFLLPLSTRTRMYMTGNARSWIHYIGLRTDEHTQVEHRHLALEAKAIFRDRFPETAEALGWW